MKPISIKHNRKNEVRKLIKEKQQLRDQHRALGYKKLKKPIRHGWYKELILLPQLERYKFQPEIEEIIEKLECHHWGRTKEMATKRWDTQVSKHLIYRDIPTLSPKSYSKLSDKAKRHCTPFHFLKYKKKWLRYYVRIPKNAFKIKFTRAYTTHSKIIDPNIMERLDLIEQQFLKPGWHNAARTKFNYKNRWKVAKVKINRKETKITLRNYNYLNLKEIEHKIQWERN